jgi:beta-alanine degradation protein BauB
MTDTDTDAGTGWLTDAPLAGVLVGTGFEGWSPELRAEFADHAEDGHVGSRLLSQDGRVRVWEIRLAPGQRWHAHRHVLDYFWTAVHAGTSRQHTSDGTTRDVTYGAGETRHFTFAEGEYLLHDIENVGAGELVFTTVEHLDSANAPLPLDESAS